MTICDKEQLINRYLSLYTEDNMYDFVVLAFKKLLNIHLLTEMSMINIMVKKKCSRDDFIQILNELPIEDIYYVGI